MFPDRASLLRCFCPLALAGMGVICPGQAAEAPDPAEDPPLSLNFSSDSSLDALLPSTLNPLERRLDRLEAGESVRGLLGNQGGSIPRPPPRASSVRPDRPRGDWTRGLTQEGAWLNVELESGRPSAAAYERAAGVRDYSAALAEGPDATSLPATPGAETPDPPQSAKSLLLSNDPDSQLSKGLEPLPTSGHSLDPMLPSGLGLPFGSSRESSPSIGLAFGAASPQRPTPASLSRATRLDLQGGGLSPLTTSQLVNSQAPRSVRELIQGAEATSANRSRELLMLDQDPTRVNLNPYLPQGREDFQFSRDTVMGDARLGIEARPGASDELASPSPLRSLSSQTRAGSSLAPAVALPLSDGSFPASRKMGQGNQYQFPSRRF